MRMNVCEIIKIFNLKELPEEGGYFRRNYECQDLVNLDRGQRHCGDGIFYLITPDQFSGLHKLLCDEIWHFYAGDPVTQIIFNETEFREIELGNTNFNQHFPQSIVPAGCWQATKLKDGGEWALIGTNAFPAYCFEDFQMGKADELCSLHLKHSEKILKYAK